MKKKENWGISCNVTGDRLFRDGAKVAICTINRGNGCERMQVRGLSLGGRKITRWLSLKNLSNFRPEFYAQAENCSKEVIKYFEHPGDAAQQAKEIQNCKEWLEGHVTK